MNRIRLLPPSAWVCTAVACLLVAPTGARAALDFTVTLNTSGLIGHPAAPFALNFQLNDGSGAGDDNNVATLTNFTFGGGSAGAAVPGLTQGGASGDLTTGVTLHDSAFLNQFTQRFTAGSSLSFKVHLTTNVDVPTPDLFTFAIFDSGFVEIPTLDPTGFNTFVTVALDSPNPAILRFGSDTTQGPAAGGGPISIGAPNVRIVPLPAAWKLGAGMTGAVVLAGRAVRRRGRAAA